MNEPVSSVVLAALATYGLHSTLFLAGALLFDVCRRSACPALRIAIWRTAMVAALATTALQASGVIQPLVGRFALIVEPAPPPAQVLDPTPLAATADPLPPSPATAHPTAPNSHAPEFTPAPPPPLDWRPILAAAWAGVAAVLAVRLAATWLAVRRGLAARRPLRQGPVWEALRGLARKGGLARSPKVSVSDQIVGPFTLPSGEICLPAWTQDYLAADQLQAMLAHETAHVVHRDSLWLVIARSLEAVFFFQPLAYLARRRMADLSELAADDWAAAHAGDGRALAECLSTFAQIAKQPPAQLTPSPLFACGMADRPSLLVRRVERLLTGGGRPAIITRSFIVLLAVGAVSLSGFLPGVMARAEQVLPRALRAPAPQTFALISPAAGHSPPAQAASAEPAAEPRPFAAPAPAQVEMAAADPAPRAFAFTPSIKVETGLSPDFDAFINRQIQAGLASALKAPPAPPVPPSPFVRISAPVVTASSSSIDLAQFSPTLQAGLTRVLGRRPLTASNLGSTLKRYYEAEHPTGAPLVEIIAAGRAVSSDTEKSHLLQKVADAAARDDTAIDAYLTLATFIDHDSEMCHALTALAEDNAIGEARLAQVLAIAGRYMGADANLSGILRTLAPRVGRSDTAATAYLQALAHIDDDNERATALEALIDHATLSGQSWKGVLQTVASIRSDSWKSNMFIWAAPRLPKDQLEPAYDVADAIFTDTWRRRAVGALVDAGAERRVSTISSGEPRT